MPQEHHQSCEAGRQADVAEHAFTEVGHLLDGETDAVVVGRRRLRGSLHPQPRDLRSRHERARPTSDRRGQARKQHPRDEWNRSEHADARREQRPARGAATADVNLMRGGADRLSRLGTAAVFFFQREDDLFDQPMLGLHHDRTERGVVRIGDAAEINRDAIESRRRKRLDLRTDLFQMPAERLFARVDAERRLELRGLDPLGRLVAMNREGVERLLAKAALKRLMHNPPTFDRTERFDLFDQQGPAKLRQFIQRLRRPADELGRLEQQERPLLDADRRLSLNLLQRGGAKFVEWARKTDRRPRRFPQRDAFQQQAHGNEFDRRPDRCRKGDAVGTDFHLVQQPRPTAQRQNRRGDVIVPLVRSHAELFERLEHQIQRPEPLAFDPRDLFRQAVEPMIGSAAGLAVECTKRAKETGFAMRHLPSGKALIRERGAIANQHLVNRDVDVFARRFEQQIAMSHRQLVGPHARLNAVHPFATDPPEHLQRERFPLLVAPGLDRAFVVPLKQIGGDGVGVVMRRRLLAAPGPNVAHHPMPGCTYELLTLRRFDRGAKPSQRIGLGDVPAQLFRRTVLQRVPEHRQPEVVARRRADEFFIGPRTEIFPQHRLDVGQTNSPLLELLAIKVLGHVRLTAEQPGPATQTFLERQVFQCLECIEKNERSDRALGRQQCADLLDHLGQSVQAPRSFVVMPRRRAGKLRGRKNVGRRRFSRNGAASLSLSRTTKCVVASPTVLRRLRHSDQHGSHYKLFISSCLRCLHVISNVVFRPSQ